MKMPILNIIISYFLLFQFSLVDVDILFNMSNISKANELHSIEACGEEDLGCLDIDLWFFGKTCWCPFKEKENLTLSQKKT